MTIDPFLLAGLLCLAAFVGVMAGIVIERDAPRKQRKSGLPFSSPPGGGPRARGGFLSE